MAGFSATSAVASVSATATAVGGPIGAVPGAIATAAAAIYDTFSGLLSGSFGVSPRPSWNAVDAIAVPTAEQIVKPIVANAGAENIPEILRSYTTKLKNYISTSPHNPEDRDFYVHKIDAEVLNMGEGFRQEAFSPDVIEQDQLCWAIYLHTMWLYAGVSENEIPNGNALRKFQESLGPTLNAAIMEVTGTVLDAGASAKGGGAGNTPGAGGPPPVVKTTAAKASFFQSPVFLIMLLGVLVFFVFQSRGKR